MTSINIPNIFAEISRPQMIFHRHYLGRYLDDRYKMAAVRARPLFYIQAFDALLDNAKNEALVAKRIMRMLALRDGLVDKALAAEDTNGAYDALKLRLKNAQLMKNRLKMVITG